MGNTNICVTLLCCLSLTVACGRAAEFDADAELPAQNALSPNLVAAYGFEEGQGATTADASGHTLTGTLAGSVTWVTGKFGKAVHFTGGSTSWVSVADNAALHLTTGMTISAWVNPAVVSNEQAIIFKERPGDLAYALYANGDAHAPNAWITKGGVENSVLASSALQAGTWTHLASTYDGTTLAIYVNGVLIRTTTVGGAIDSVSGALRIGGDSIWSGENFKGVVDEVRIYNVAQSAAQIQADMAVAVSPPGVDTTPPVGSIAINGGASATNASAVTLTLSASDASGVTQMRLSDDGVTYGSPVAYSTSLAWTLSSGDGAKSVFVEYKDTPGNWSSGFVAHITLDTVPPVLSGIAASAITSSSATLGWTSNEGASSIVDYGTTAAYGQSSPLNPALVTAHAVTIGGLNAVTTYHYRVRSSDAAGNPAASGDNVFTTASAGSGGSTTIVSTHQIHQDWGQSVWSSSNVTIANVQAGDTIIVLGLYWVSSGTGAAPSDNGGTLVAAVNQVPNYQHPPTASQIYYELHAAAGTHVITPPNLAYGGDGTLYVLQVRGLTGVAVTSGNNHVDGTALTSISTQLASNAQVGDFVVGVGGEDDAQSYGPNAGMSGPPAGWQSIGVQNDSDLNIPSAAYSRTVAAAGPQPVTWTWNDNTANTTMAAMAAFR